MLDDPLGTPDSGMTAKEAIFEVSEQMIVGGWIKADDGVTIQIDSSASDQQMISFNDGIKSLITDKGSTILTKNDHSFIDIRSNESVRIASDIYANGAHSQIKIQAAAGINLLEGSNISTPDNGSSIDLTSGEYIHMNAGSALSAGATYEYLNDILNPEKTGENASINIETEGELIISGSVISSGGLNIAFTGSLLDHSEYFDTIKGKTIASMLSSNEILQALNNGSIPEEMISLIKQNNIILSDSARIHTTNNYRDFNDLTVDQKNTVAQKLGDAVYEGVTSLEPLPLYRKILISHFLEQKTPLFVEVFI
jgi:hypothetical protein